MDPDARRDSPANRALWNIARRLLQPSIDINDWLEAHPANCPCVWCADPENGAIVAGEARAALAGLHWNIECCVAVLGSCITGAPEEAAACIAGEDDEADDAGELPAADDQADTEDPVVRRMQWRAPS